MDNQIKQTFLGNKRTIGLVQSGFVTLVAGEITEAGHSLRSTPATPGDSDFEEVLGNALGSIANDPETYARMWNALGKESRKLLRFLGFWKKGIRKHSGQSYVSKGYKCDETVKPLPNKPKSIKDMSFEELGAFTRMHSGLKEGIEDILGLIK